MMTDLFTTAMSWLKANDMPEPTSMSLHHTEYVHRIELNYHDREGLPQLEWRDRERYSIAEVEVEGGLVSVLAPREGVSA